MKGKFRKLIRIMAGTFLTVIALYVAIILYGLFAWQESILPGSTSTAHTDSMEPVDITMGDGVKLRIPKAYLTDKKTWQGGQQEWVNIDIYWPSMEPLAKGKKDEQVIFIDINKASIAPKKWAFEAINNYIDVLSNYLENTEFGLTVLYKEKYQQVKGTKFSYISSQSRDVYFYLNENQAGRIPCERSHGCRAYINFNPHLSGSFGFRESSINEFASINKSVTSLISAFMINPKTPEISNEKQGGSP